MPSYEKKAQAGREADHGGTVRIASEVLVPISTPTSGLGSPRLRQSACNSVRHARCTEPLLDGYDVGYETRVNLCHPVSGSVR
jgi:hypothetical protein